MSQGVDDTIVCLMSMGFDIQDCQDAINFGKNTVEAAVEWIVAGKPGLHPNTAGGEKPGPSLKLRSTTSAFGSDSTSVPFQKPYPIQESCAQSQSDTSQSKSTECQSGDVTSASGQPEVHVISRMHMGEAQRKYKENFEQKKIDEAKKQAVLEKRRHKEEHARILKEIAEDREKKKLLQPPTHSEAKKASTDTDLSERKEQKTVTPSSSSGTCLLQIRLPDGRSLRQSFSPASTLKQVWEFTASHHRDMSGYIFIQPFPHHEFTSADMPSTMTDLKLTPTGSLVLQKKQTPSPVTEPSTSPEPMETISYPPTVEANRDLPSQVRDPPRGHRWGQGFSLENENQIPPQQGLGQPAGEEIMEEEEDEEDPHLVAPGALGRGNPWQGLGMPGGIAGHRMPPPPGNIMGQGHDIFGMQIGEQGNNQAFGGVGQRLVPMGDPSHNDAYQHRSVRELALERAQARLAQPAQEPRQSPGSSSGTVLSVVHQPVQSLLVHCLKHIMHRLNDPRNQLLSLAGISEDMAQVILEFLVKEKQLKPKTLNAFIPCYLRKLILDCYPYTTNELLHSVRLHTNLSHLSLSACPLITDNGLQCLTTLKKLKKLNLSCCKQLSNKCVSAVSSLQNLVSLNAEDTGLTDQGVIQYLSSQPEHLQLLNLNRTAVTQAIIPHVQTCAKQLRSLYLEDTKVVSLSGIRECEHLECLNVARTGIVTESLFCLADHPGLRSLNIANTDNVNGDKALKHLTGLNLHTLVLPSRHTTTNIGIKYISDLSLVSLDLTNYILVGDEAMEHIGRMKSLKQLILSNTKVTDVGMFFLEGLTQLEVLNVDRTLVTDQGAQVIGALTSLVELSMACTGVTTKFLLSGVCNNCCNLAKLNLSKTMVTKKGVLNLSLPFLQMINLDGTKVTPDLNVAMMTDCPKLTQMSTRNLEPFTRDDEIEEADMDM
ncbi:uncharacterized protein LOC123532610 [Mercenaria mercenaria]|uniref:uncharacterized protein LOC123532610 n=1 Tax=Mercenaria mercenaria TaxID=6596 RepID=UPI00234E64F7|nr:uncharacterized protein LOC123532610 [Mercenaria mercenaria]